MPIFTRTCTVSGDAGYSNDNGGFGTNVIDFAQYPNLTGYDWDGFIRFQNVQIPRGAEIVSAYVDAHGYAETETINVRIYGNDADDAAAPTSKATHDAKVRTTAYAAWTVTTEWTDGIAVQTPSLVSVVQEIINRDGWLPGNAVMILIDEYASNDDIRSLYVYAANPSYAPILTIVYRIASPHVMILRSRR